MRVARGSGTPVKAAPGEGIDFVTCLLCHRAFKSISPPHLIHKHHFDPEHPVHEYKERFGVSSSMSLDVIQRRVGSHVRHLVRVGRRWTRDRVIREIQTLQRHGKPLNTAALEATDATLIQEGRMLFRTWENAIRSAGIDYERIRLARPRWSDEEILKTIRKEHRQGRDLSYAAVAVRNMSLANAGRRRFRGWRGALEAAGVEPERVMRIRTWDKPKIVSAIRKLGRQMPTAKIGHADHALQVVAAKFFGTWVAAVQAAGIEYLPGRKRWSWCKDEVVRAIGERVASGESIKPGVLRRKRHGLFAGAVRLFGCWEAAVQAARLRKARS